MASRAATPPRAFRAAGTTEALRIGALGANAWATALLLPALHGGMRGALDALLVPLPLALAIAGAIALALGNGHEGATPTRAAVGRVGGAAGGSGGGDGGGSGGGSGGAGAPIGGARRTAAIALLLFAFPVALAAVLAGRADLADREVSGPLGLLVAALSLLAYGAAAADACARPRTLRASTAQVLASPRGAEEPAARTWLRRFVLGGTALAGLAIAVVAPASGSRAALVRAWGEAADEATVLASIVGAAASAIGIAGLLGPRLRAARPSEVPSAQRRAVRAGVAMLLASIALAAYLVLRALESGR